MATSSLRLGPAYFVPVPLFILDLAVRRARTHRTDGTGPPDEQRANAGSSESCSVTHAPAVAAQPAIIRAMGGGTQKPWGFDPLRTQPPVPFQFREVFPMNKPGKPSAASLQVAPVAVLQPGRPAAPDDLSDRERALWRSVTGAMPPDYFRLEHRPQLRDYVRHLARGERFDRLIADADDRLIVELDRLCRMRERETRAALALARSLRLTMTAQIRPETAGRRSGQSRGLPDIDWSEKS